MSASREFEGLTSMERSIMDMLVRQHSVLRRVQEKNLGVWTAPALLEAVIELSMTINELQDQLADLMGEDT